MATESPIADALYDSLLSADAEDRTGESANVVDGMFAIARSLDLVARALRDLGNGDAATPMGAIEAMSVKLNEGLSSISTSIEMLADAVKDSRE
jgi:hypothetical protein